MTIRSLTGIIIFENNLFGENEKKGSFMIYPEFLKKGARVGITAPSCGISAEKAPLFCVHLTICVPTAGI